MCRKEKFSECPGNPQRHFLELIRIFGERINTIGPTGYARDRGRAQGGGRAPHPRGQGVGPLVLILSPVFFINFQNYSPWSFSSFRELLFLHKNNTMAILLKTASVRVSSIQIIQVRVQNKGKSVWKSRRQRRINSPKLKPLLVLKQFSWQTEREKEKLLQTLFALVVVNM